MCRLQACNNILRNNISKMLKILNETIRLWNATHFTMDINLSHSADMAVAENNIKTDELLPHYSGHFHSAGKALKLVDKCTRCSFGTTAEAAKVVLPRK